MTDEETDPSADSAKKTIIAILSAVIVVGLIGALIVTKPWYSPTLDETIESLEYVPVVPPSQLTKPGGLVLVAQRNPLVLDMLCTAEGSLGISDQEYLTSRTATINESKTLATKSSLGFDLRDIGASDQVSSTVQSVEVRLSDARILTISDEQVFELVANRSEACAMALANRLEQDQEVTMIRSVLVADANAVVTFSGSASTELKTAAIEQVAGELGLTLAADGESSLVGDDLYWGIRDDPSLVGIGPGAATGAGDQAELLTITEPVREIRQDRAAVEVQALRQPTPNSCWATAGAMLANWRDGTNLTPEEFAASLGDSWAQLFEADSGLPMSAHVEFAEAAGFEAMAPQNQSIEGYETMLRETGPVWIAAVGDTFSAHARVLVAVHGDGSPPGTEFSLVDPRTGEVTRQPFLGFIDEFEREALAQLRGGSTDFRWQMIRLQ